MSIEEETINCKHCGEKTVFLGTRLCNWCYSMETGIYHLIRRLGKEGAKKRLSEVFEQQAGFLGLGEDKEVADAEV